MQIVHFGQQLNSPIVVCLGYFGCVHKGHYSLLQRAKLLAKQTNASVALFTFCNNHLKVLKQQSKQLFTFEERMLLYQNCGVDVVMCQQFDDSFRDIDALTFLKIFDNYDIKGVVCGFDYTCGSDKKGADFVKQYFTNCIVIVQDKVCSDCDKISTSQITSLICNNKIEQANNLLEFPFFVSGKVVHGRHVGSQMGFPTANIQFSADKLLPTGVFVGKTNVLGVDYKCIVNIGAKPTFDLENVTCEVYIVGFDGDLYDKNLTVYLCKFLRDIVKFDNLQQLKNQLILDKESATND